MLNQCVGNALTSKPLFNGDRCQFKRLILVLLELGTANKKTIRRFSNNKVLPIQIHWIDADAMNKGTDLQGIGFNSRA